MHFSEAAKENAEATRGIGVASRKTLHSAGEIYQKVLLLTIVMLAVPDSRPSIVRRSSSGLVA